MYRTLSRAIGNRVDELVGEYERTQYFFAKLCKRHNEAEMFERVYNESLKDYIQRAANTNIRGQVEEFEENMYGFTTLGNDT